MTFAEQQRLKESTDEMAKELYNIRQKMIGRGVSPKDSSLVEAKLERIERRLKSLGSSNINPIPDTI